MVKSCCAVGCTNRHSKGSSLSFYRFPVDPERRGQWIAVIKREDWAPNEHSFVCSAHFITGRKSQDPLSPNFVPNLFKYIDNPAKKKKRRDVKKYENRKRLLRRKIVLEKVKAEKEKEERKRVREQEAMVQVEARETAAAALLTLTESNLPEPTMSVSDTVVQSDLTVTDIRCLEDKCTSLQVGEKYLLTEDGFKCDDAVRFYTGLPSYPRLKAVFDYASGCFKGNHGNSSLSLFQEFLITLMKIHLNLRDQDFGFRFGVSQSTLSRIFRKWIDILYVRLKPIIQWPSRAAVAKTMPFDFRRDFGRCICIIDCFEVFCERPSNLMARAQTFSNYKHHNTVKFLIAITPQGVVSFVSKGWGGRVSDKYLTENCGRLNYLEPGDVVLANRGFTIQDSVGIYCAEVKTPPFTKGKKQLAQHEVDTARQLSRV